MTMDEMKTHYETLLDALTNEMQAMRKELQECKEKLSQDQCEDCISREAVVNKLDYLCDCLCEYSKERRSSMCCACKLGSVFDALDDLPSVSPMPKMGRWIYDRTRDWDGECKYECSECGMGSDVDYPYCMRCGAKMAEESEDKK